MANSNFPQELAAYFWFKRQFTSINKILQFGLAAKAATILQFKS